MTNRTCSLGSWFGELEVCQRRGRPASAITDQSRRKLPYKDSPKDGRYNYLGREWRSASGVSPCGHLPQGYVQMYMAELRGKLSASQERSEDILTSNVFSFFKYAERSVYLSKFLSLIGVELTDDELQEVEFVFWPTYEDGTEPDVVLLAQDHYLLFEAKYHSGFGTESEDREAQIPRELEAGRKDAEVTGKAVFKMIAITDHPCYPSDSIPARHQDEVVWTNWQSVSGILLDALEEEGTPNPLLTHDLYDLLVKKRLRGFLSFDRLKGIYPHRQYEELFFSAASSSFRGQFIGFQEALKEHKPPTTHQGALFFSQEYFVDLPHLDVEDSSSLFYRRQL